MVFILIIVAVAVMPESLAGGIQIRWVGTDQFNPVERKAREVAMVVSV